MAVAIRRTSGQNMLEHQKPLKYSLWSQEISKGCSEDLSNDLWRSRRQRQCALCSSEKSLLCRSSLSPKPYHFNPVQRSVYSLFFERQSVNGNQIQRGRRRAFCHYTYKLKCWVIFSISREFLCFAEWKERRTKENIRFGDLDKK